MSKTQDALRYVGQGVTPYAAAKLAGIKAPTLYAAIKRERVRLANASESKDLRCACCGQLIDKTP